MYIDYKKSLLDTVKRHINNLTSSINEINQAKDSGRYTPQGIQQFVESINTTFAVAAETNRAEALKVVDQAMDAFKKKNKGTVVADFKDSGAMIGLSNVLAMLKDGSVTEDDFSCIIEAFIDNSFAMNCIKDTVRRSKENAKLLSMIPCTYDDQIELFDKLKLQINKYIRPVHTDNNVGAQMGLQAVIKAVESLDKDLLMPKDFKVYKAI